MKTRNWQLAKYIIADCISMTVAFVACQIPLVNCLLIAWFWISVYWISGYYNEVMHRSRLTELITTIVSITLGYIVIAAVLLYMQQPSLTLLQHLLQYFATHLIATYTLRFSITQEMRNRMKSGDFFFKAVVVGTGRNALNLAENIDVRTIGYIDAKERHETVVDHDMILGNIEHLVPIVKENKADEIIIATEEADNQLIFNILKEAYTLEAEVKVIESLRILPHVNMPVDSIMGNPFISLSKNKMPHWQQNVKRIFDICFSLVALTAAAPLMLFIALLIKATSKGPVFYLQERIGHHGHKFNIIKFRSMHTDAEQNVPLLSSEDDKRITKVGRTLRRFRLDELPQFLNVLRGDMSIVGYRPERAYFVDKISEKSPEYHLLLRILPGITSWGMVKYGYATSVEKMAERLQYDIMYIENCSILIDIKILIHTFIIIFRGREIIKR